MAPFPKYIIHNQYRVHTLLISGKFLSIVELFSTTFCFVEIKWIQNNCTVSKLELRLKMCV